ncbi:MAG: hypothetical protein WBL19_02185 [Minisyncoccia bacterium]
MRRYIQKLRQKPDHHKRNFAFLVSGTVTLIIFGVWSAVNFGGETKLADESGSRVTGEVSPLESMRMNLGSSIEAVRSGIGGIKDGVEDINLQLEYEEMRNKALESYE